MAQAAINYKCALCETEDNVDYYCLSCEEILCTSCKLLHLKSRKTKNDDVVALTQAWHDGLLHKSTVVYCRKHSSVEITLFCLKCDQLICTECLAETHGGHNITTLDKIRDSKAEKLKMIVKILKEKKADYGNAFDCQGEAHSRFLKSIDQVEKEMLEQNSKIVEELNIICKKQISEIKKLRQNEEKNYTVACNKIQLQNQAVTTAIQTAENGLASNNTAIIVQAAIDTTDTLHELEDPIIPLTKIATYQPGDRSYSTICHVQGKVNLEQIVATHHPDCRNRTSASRVQDKVHREKGAKPKQKTDVQKVKPQKQKTNGDNKQYHGVNKSNIDIDKVQVKSKVEVKGKDNIYIIVPLQNNKAWLHCDIDPYLTLIDNTGRIITESTTLDSYVVDAKIYRNGLLVTCHSQCLIYNLSADGKSTSTFAVLSPYNTRGLCVTRDMDVMVCLYISSTDNKVVRLNKTGHIIQTLQHGIRGAPLYEKPWRVTSLTTGEVIVRCGNKIVGVDREGVHLFTWEGEIQGKKLGNYRIYSITHDSNKNLFVTDVNNGVFVLDKDGSGAMCLLDRTHGINKPRGIAIDKTGQLWVGCSGGKIHIIEY